MPRGGPVHHHHHYTSHYMSHSKLQSPLTIQWLNENYEVADGVSLPRSALYNHYLDFCQKNNLTPVNAASFGKIIRHTFPNLKTRRLGTRGQSKYHYYGITIKETSPYHDTVCNAARQSSSGFSQTYSKSEADERVQGNQKNPNASQSSLLVASGGTLLPDFPSTIRFKLPENVLKDKVKTFLIMYRAHCQRILDTILRANFGEVQNFLVHFWQGMPSHMLEVLGCQEVVDIIGLCDSILYKSIGSVLIPGTLQPLPASLTQAIRQFAKQLSVWLESSLAHLPKPLQEKKLTVAKNFSHSLQRQTSLTHLAQAARTVLHSAEPVIQMLGDWKHIDFESITRQALWTFSNEPEKDYTQVNEFYKEFTQLLDQQATIDQYAEWAASLVDRCVSKKCEKSDQTYQECAQEFLLKWSFFSTRVVRELTLRSAQSFGSFHLLHMLLEDYILYVVETKTNGNEDEFAAMVAKESAIEEENNLKSTSDVIEMISAAPLLRSEENPGKQKAPLPPNHPIDDSLISKLPSNIPAMRSPTYAQVAPVPSLSSPGSDSGYSAYPSSKTSMDISNRYNYSSAASYMFPMSSTDRIYQASGIHPSPVGNNLTDLTSRGSYSPYRDIQTSISSSRSKANISMGSGNYSMMPSPYDYRPPSVPPNCYTQYPVPERSYAPGYVLPPGVVTPSPMYPSGHTDRYFPDAIEEFVDMQAAGHHGVDHRLNTFTPTILST